MVQLYLEVYSIHKQSVNKWKMLFLYRVSQTYHYTLYSLLQQTIYLVLMGLGDLLIISINKEN